MPYFIYNVFDCPDEMGLEYVEEHEAFVEAKTRVRKMRAELPENASHTIKIMFAADRDEAETLFREKREAPVLKEWEK